MKREGYYGLLLALLAIAVLYYLNKAGLLHSNSQYSMDDDAATLREMAGGDTAVVSATVGGVPVGSSTTTYPKSSIVIGDEFDVVPISTAQRYGRNTF